MTIQYTIMRYAAGKGPAKTIATRKTKDAARLRLERDVRDMLAADGLLDRPVAARCMSEARAAIPDIIRSDGKRVIRLRADPDTPCVIISWVRT